MEASKSNQVQDARIRELETLAISMQLFIQILTKISEIQNVVKDNKDLLQIIAVLSAYTQKELGFMRES